MTPIQKGKEKKLPVAEGDRDRASESAARKWEINAAEAAMKKGKIWFDIYDQRSQPKIYLINFGSFKSI